MRVRTSGLDSERIAEMAAEDMKGLGLNEGSVVRLKGRRTCEALAVLAQKGTVAQGEIALGARLQERLGVMNGSDVTAMAAKVPPAERIKFLASTSGMPGEDVSYMLKGGQDDAEMSAQVKLAIAALGYQVVRKGECLVVTPLGADMLEAVHGSGVLAPEVNRVAMETQVYVKIVDTVPAGIVAVGPKTEWVEANEKEFIHGAKEISFTQIGGLAAVKRQLRQSVEGPLRNPEAYRKWGVRAIRGILLFGPPGCGKTMLAKAVAKELDAELIYIRGAEIYNCYFGASEELVREIFRQARRYPRCIIFWDEFDAVGTARGTAGNNSRLFDTILNQILVEMDGMGTNDSVIVIAATNRVDQLDPALKRPGRFDHIVRIPMPCESDREEILRVHLEGKPGADKLDIPGIARRANGWTGADLENLVRLACLEAMERGGEMSVQDVESAFGKCRPSLSKEQVEYYESEDGARKCGKDDKKPMYG